MTPPERLRYWEPLLKGNYACNAEGVEAAVASLLNNSDLTTVLPLWIDGLMDDEPSIHHAACIALQTIAPAALPAVPSLIKLLEDERRQSGAIDVLMAIGPAAANAIPALITVLQIAKCELDRAAAAASLGVIGPGEPMVVRALIEALNDDWVRPFAASAIGEMGSLARDAVEALILVLRLECTWENEQAIANAAYALGAIGPSSAAAVPALVDLLDLEWSTVPRIAAAALGKIGRAAEPAIPALIKEMQNPLSFAFPESAVALASLGHHQLAVESLTNVFVDKNKSAWKRMRALDALRRLLGRGDLDIMMYQAFETMEHGKAMDAEARTVMPQLKLFYLTFRVYMEGKDAIRSAAESLETHRFTELTNEDLPVSHVSVSSYIRKREPLFSEIFDKGSLRLLYQPSKGERLHFTKDAQKAWEWTDTFLRYHLPGTWFGFHRLTPEH